MTVLPETAQTTEGNPTYGPQSDYAIVFSFQRKANASVEWYHWYRYEPAYHDLSTQEGPFRMALLAKPFTSSDYSCMESWGPRDSMAWWSDGTSNQMIVGEKHIAASRVGDPTARDANYLMGGESMTPYMGRLLRMTTTSSAAGNMDIGGHRLALPTNETTDISTGGSTRFGSAHPGVVLFLFGDGSVRPVQLTTPENILAALGTVNDGTTITLPGFN